MLASMKLRKDQMEIIQCIRNPHAVKSILTGNH